MKKRQCGPLSYGFSVMPSDVLWVTRQVLLQMKGKYVEDSTFTSHFSDCQKLS